MTEYIIVYKPRGRPVNYPYKSYKQIGPPRTNSFTVWGLDFIGGTVLGVNLYAGSTIYFAQQFTAPSLDTGVSEIQFGAVRFHASKTGSPTGTATVTLRADSAGVPGSTIGTIGSFDVSTLGTSATLIELTAPAGMVLTSGAKYWIVAYYNGGNSSNYITLSRANTDEYPGHVAATSTNGTSWTTSAFDWRISLRLRYVYTYTFSFPYSSAFGSEKRLEHSSFSGLSAETTTVNNISVSPPLSKDDVIPQATDYTITGRYLHTTYVNGNATVSITTTPYLYFNDPDLDVEDLGASEAYLLRVVFAENGSILRINGLVDSDLYGNANQAIDLADLAVPVRRLEWIYGSGECTLLVID